MYNVVFLKDVEQYVKLLSKVTNKQAQYLYFLI